jgi:4-hydroxy-2-oxoheptanedioate aldolase
METRLARVWGAGEAAVNGWLSIPSTVTAEMVARQDYDSIVVDLQHGLIDYQMALTMIQAIGAASDATVIGRPPWNEPGIIMKLLDAGAWGILCPMVNKPADAEALIRACHYAPRGQRSVGPTRAMMVYGPSYIQDANRHVVTLAMIETREALDNVEAIARTPDLSGLYIGPSDLAQSLGYPIQIDPTGADTMAAIERILSAAKAAGIKAGMHCMMPDYARSMVEKGFDFVTLGNDVRMLTAELAARVGAFRGR